MEVLQKQPDVIDFVKTVAQEQGIKNPTIIHVQTNDKGEGFLGQIFIITLQDAACSEKNLSVVIKASFEDNKIRELIPIKTCFENEILFYTKVFPYFKKFELECGVSKIIEFVPKVYKELIENNRELICLENLKELGFEVFPKTNVLNDEHVRLIFEMYGRFHAYSFALRDQKPEEFAEITDKVVNIFEVFLNDPNGQSKDHIKLMSEQAQKYLISGEDDTIIKKFEKYKDYEIVKCYTECLTQKSDYDAFLHGDCWSNNMMFKYDKSENCKKLVDMRLLDLQLVRIGSPVCDLSYCLYSGGSKPIFDNLNKYLEIYHKSFSSFLKELGSDPEKLFPFKALKEEWKKYSKFGMIVSFGIWKIKATNKEDVLDFTDFKDSPDALKAAAEMKFNEEMYGERVRDILQHMVEIDAL